MDINIENKYGIIYIDKERYYQIDLSQKRYDLENTRPAFMRINGRILEANNWARLVVMVSDYITEKNKLTSDELMSFKASWSSSIIFHPQKLYKASFELKNGLYINTNHSAVHCFWLIKELLEWKGYDVSSISILIKRSGVAEPSEVIEYYISKNIKGYLKYLLLITPETNKASIGKHLEYLKDLDKRFTVKASKNTVSLFLIDNNQTFLNFKSDLLKYLKTKTTMRQSHITYTMDIISEYYEYLKTTT